MNFLSIDIGTSIIKTGIVSVKGEILGIVQRESPINMQDKLVEFDVEEGWLRIVSSIREVLQQSGVQAADIGGISVTCQGQTFVALDDHNRPMRNAIVWLDQRAIKERDEIVDSFGQEKLYSHCGLVHLSPGVMICCLSWIHHNEPEIYQKAKLFIHISDYVLYRLSGKIIAERSIYYCSGLYDIGVDSWWEEMLAYLDLPATKLPTLIDSMIPFATLTSEAALETGLSSKTQIVSGTLDVVASILGAGAITAGKVMLDFGTTMKTMMTVFDIKPLLETRKMWIFGHVLAGANIGVTWRETAGFSLRWFRDAFCSEEQNLSKIQNKDVYDLILSNSQKVPAGSNGLLFLPNLQGTMLPESHSDAKGVFWGIIPSHTKAHFVRAILEGNAFTLRENLEIMQQLGFNCSEIVASGGATRNQLWNQINSDVTGFPLHLLKCNESSVLGAGILAACGTGFYTNIEEGCKMMVQRANVIIPDPSTRDIYEEGYQRYKALFQATIGL